MTYAHLTELDDPAKPYKRVWRCEATGLHVKTHAARREVGFGRVKWDITGSLCDAAGTALTDETGAPLIHVEGHGLSVQTDRGLRTPDLNRLIDELIAAKDHVELEAVRRRAVLLRQAALSPDDVRAIMRDDFERELRFVVSKVERAALQREAASGLGGVKLSSTNPAHPAPP